MKDKIKKITVNVYIIGILKRWVIYKKKKKKQIIWAIEKRKKIEV